MSNIACLEVEDVLSIHERLTIDAAETEDPISPPGVKNEGLLDSAVARQFAGYQGNMKYDDPISNAASLCYGICSNHAFHNGNKRTALVSLMCHLDKNGRTFKDNSNQNTLYSFILSVASHTIVPKNKLKRGKHDKSDLEILEMSEWIKKKTRKVTKGDRSLSYVEFEKILRQHDVYFENHKNNYVDVVRYEMVDKKKGWFRTEKVREGRKVANIPHWPGRTVGKNLVNSVRKQAGLTHADGVDSALFYGDEVPPDDFIQKYKTVLRKLAKT